MEANERSNVSNQAKATPAQPNAYDCCWKLSVGIQLDRGYVVRIAMRCRRSCKVGYENGGEVLLSVMMYIIVYNLM